MKKQTKYEYEIIEKPGTPRPYHVRARSATHSHLAAVCETREEAEATATRLRNLQSQ